MCNAKTYHLPDISKWFSEEGEVQLPALQRGLVWKPSQIEILWDSLMRRIPIGSFVICEGIETQTVNAKPNKNFYHLLDGQQRANAIQIGFNNPFCYDSKAILWLDINPKQLPLNSTRSFLFRLTTIAHPWGYDNKDECGVLSASRIRKELVPSREMTIDEEIYRRPTPQELYPFEANYPIPMGLLWEIFKSSSSQTLSLEQITKYLNDNEYGTYKWAAKICQANAKDEEKDSFQRSLAIISKGLRDIETTTIIALITPPNLLEATKQEECVENDGKEDITNIEHLFHRLNRQGTELGGEELIYSMMKAYWPEIRNAIDNIESEKKLMPASRLVSLAMRTIIMEDKIRSQNNNDPVILSSLNIAQARHLSVDSEKAGLKKSITTFITDGLKETCNKVDKILLFNEENRQWGLPPYVRSSIAWNKPDIYLFLMLMERKFKCSENDDISKALAGIVTWLKWFGGNIQNILSILYRQDSLELSIIKNVVNNGCLSKIFTPGDVNRFLTLPEAVDDRVPNSVSQWRFDSLFGDGFENRIQKTEKDMNKLETFPEASEELIQKAREQWRHFIDRLRKEREILLYAQRNYLNSRFNYDPSRKDFWEGHNRPWDFDHIFARTFAHGIKKDNSYLGFCQEWRDSNGNMRAWPFEANRSDQARKANEKISGKQIEYSFIKDEKELEDFSVGKVAVSKPEEALRFAHACKSRLIRIYTEWYEKLGISQLLMSKSE